MKNIMKSIWYEILKSKFVIRIYVFFIIVMGLVAVLNVGDIIREGYSTSLMLAENPTISYEFPIFILAMIVGVICGEDYRDKVANYEVLSGHSRKSIYLARSLMGVLVATLAALFLCFVPLLVGTLIAGWGDSLVLKEVLIRHLLFFFPFLRLAAFFVVLTFLIKNPNIMMAVGFIVCMASSVLNYMLSHSKNVFISLFNLGLLTQYEGWSIYNLDPEIGIVNYSAYNSSISSGTVIGTIVVSVIVTIFYLFMGYALFRRDELN